MNAAQALWKYLDELASKNPDEYKRFIQQQQEEAALEQDQADQKLTFTPEPAFCISTKRSDNKPGTLFINFCSSSHMPGLQTKRPPNKPATGKEDVSNLVIPLSVGMLEEIEPGKQSCDVVFPTVAITRSSSDLGFKLAIVELALTHMEEDHKLRLSRQYQLESSAYRAPKNRSTPARHMTEEGARVRQERLARAEKLKEAASKPPPEVVLPTASARAAVDAEDDSVSSLRLPTNASVPAKKPAFSAVDGKQTAKSEQKPMIQIIPNAADSADAKTSEPLLSQVSVRKLQPTGKLTNSSAPAASVAPAKTVPSYKLDVQATSLVVVIDLPLVVCRHLSWLRLTDLCAESVKRS